MTARELIKRLETCDLDKQVAVVVQVVGESEEGYDVMLRDVQEVIENEDVIGIQ